MISDSVLAINKFKKNKPDENNLQIDLDQIKRLLVNPLDKNYKSRFTIKIGQHLKIILTENIECFYSENKGTYIYTSDKRDYLIDSTLEVLEADLDPTKFFRVNRKFYVNLEAIKDIISYSNSRLQIILNTFNNHEIIVSRERVKDFKNWIG